MVVISDQRRAGEGVEALFPRALEHQRCRVTFAQSARPVPQGQGEQHVSNDFLGFAGRLHATWEGP